MRRSYKECSYDATKYALVDASLRYTLPAASLFDIHWSWFTRNTIRELTNKNDCTANIKRAHKVQWNQLPIGSVRALTQHIQSELCVLPRQTALTYNTSSQGCGCCLGRQRSHTTHPARACACCLGGQRSHTTHPPRTACSASADSAHTQLIQPGLCVLSRQTAIGTKLSLRNYMQTNGTVCAYGMHGLLRL